MYNKFYIILFLNSIILCNAFSQSKVDEYEPPKVIEGSNLILSSNPGFNADRYGDNVLTSTVRYNLNLGAEYTKWRFTDKIDFAINTDLGANLIKYSTTSASSNDYRYSSLSFNLRGGSSYYLIKNKIFAGAYVNASGDISSESKPGFSISVNPYIGYGRITDAYVVNETSNFQDVLQKENYISKPFDKRARLVINNLLDKRNGNEFYSKYKDDADIEFFTEVEKFLLEEKIISKPLNARTTLKLLQTLNNRKYIIFPLLKGYQLQAEFDNFTSTLKDTLIMPITITLNAVYGLPLSSKNSILFSGSFIFPLNKNYNVDFRDFNLHSPIFLRSLFQNRSANNLVSTYFYHLDYDLYDYKASANIHYFHYLNPTAGIRGNIEYIIGKRKNLSNHYRYFFNANTSLVFNILNKLRFLTGISFSHYNKSRYNFSFDGGLSYFIF